MPGQSPVKVWNTTKERIRWAATALRRSQAEVVDEAVTDYIARHQGELSAGIKNAHEALLQGPVAAAAYVMEEDPERIQALFGETPAPTPNEPSGKP